MNIDEYKWVENRGRSPKHAVAVGGGCITTRCVSAW